MYCMFVLLSYAVVCGMLCQMLSTQHQTGFGRRRQRIKRVFITTYWPTVNVPCSIVVFLPISECGAQWSVALLKDGQHEFSQNGYFRSLVTLMNLRPLWDKNKTLNPSLPSYIWLSRLYEATSWFSWLWLQSHVVKNKYINKSTDKRAKLAYVECCVLNYSSVIPLPGVQPLIVRLPLARSII